ncbi:hypothetical protein C8Q74DRAFT_1214903 [Fomes fomentarius]|nr:hypothetical protein C8Q74DRAFT_1214903 [Fomes fomentarius]
MSSASSNSPPYLPSKDERTFYYSDILGKAYGPEAYRRLKQMRGVFGHKLNDVWNKEVGPLVRDLLTTQRVPWTTIDVARFVTEDGDGDEEFISPVVIWIGVRPDSLRGEDAFSSSNEILGLLARFDINDVEVEYRESVYRRLAGPALLRSVSNSDATVHARGPLTPALGLSIAPSDSEGSQGTMALYFAEGRSSNKVLGLSCHHILFQTHMDTNDNYVFAGGNAPRKYVELLGARGFDKLLTSIKVCIGSLAIMLPSYEEWIKKLLADTHKKIEELVMFYTKVEKDWDQPENRTIGHIRSSPAIALNVGPEGFTEDWGASELDGDKFKDAFRGNYIDLGTDSLSSLVEFLWMVYGPDRTNKLILDHPRYAYDHLLSLSGIISEEMMCKPDMLDTKDATYLHVIKNGIASGVTIGRATGMFSFVRDDVTGQVSKAWAIYNFHRDPKITGFSAPGDSGSIIVDGHGRIGGLLTGGTGKEEAIDVTYATPMWWLWPRIQEHFPNAHLYPTTMAK